MQVAPYAADEVGQLADLPIQSLPAPTTELWKAALNDGIGSAAWERVSAWVQQQRDGPFTETDFEADDRHFCAKVLHQSEMDAEIQLLFSVMLETELPLSAMLEPELPLLRLPDSTNFKPPPPP